MPKRIQRKRSKGWRMPEGAVYVGRPTKWGNPFSVFHSGSSWCVGWLDHNGNAQVTIDKDSRTSAGEAAVRLYQAWLNNEGREPGQIRDDGGAFILQCALQELRGKDLVCWCPLDRACHADVLLDLANREEP